jgi:hypothetical protein
MTGGGDVTVAPRQSASGNCLVLFVHAKPQRRFSLPLQKRHNSLETRNITGG